MPGVLRKFDVRFLRQGIHGLRATFVGRGVVEISDDVVTLSGKKRAVFGFRRAATERIPFEKVVDVSRMGTSVRFAVRGLEPGPGTVAFSATNDDDAMAIAAQLPATETPGAALEREEAMDFGMRLGRATPRAPVGPTLIAMNVIVFAIMVASGVHAFAPKTPELVAWGANFAPLTTDGQGWRLLTAAFLHGGLIHLALNMYALFALGPIVERLYGNVSFLWIYLFSALLGSAGSIFWKQDVVSVGASGAVFGVYGALLAYLLAQRGSVPGSILQGLMVSTLTFVGYNLVFGFAGTGIDNAAHLGGLIGGFGMGYVVARPLGPAARRATSGSRFVAGLAVGAIVLLVALALVPESARAFRQDAAFREEAARFADEEQKLIGEFNQIVKDWKERSLDDRTVADRVAPLVPRWAGAHARLSALTLDDDRPLKKRHTLLVRYVGLRRDQFATLVAALRARDAAKFEEFQRVRAAADGALKELNAAAGARSREN